MSDASVDATPLLAETSKRGDIPYVGPRPIEAGDPFFGREEEAEALVDKLLPGGITLLHSPSGAGKTSLIQASVVPWFRDQGFQICTNVGESFSALRVNLPPPEDIEVTNRYVFSLVDGLVGHLVDRHEAARMTFDKALTLFAAGEQRRQLVVIDQLEEALTLDPNDRQGQRELFKQLGAALRRDRRWALLAIREDYLGGLDRFRQFFPNELRTTFRLDFLDEDAALRAIQLPAQEFGVTFTDEAADQLVSDLRRVRAVSATPPTRAQREDPPASGSPGGSAGATATTPAPADPIIEEAIVYPYVEPVLLQVVCNKLWRILKEKRKAAFTAIEASDLDEVRPYSKSLSNYYRTALREAAGDDADVERGIRAWIERELLTKQKTRRPTHSLPSVEHARNVVEKLQRHYLIRDDPRPGGVFFELSHDMLVQTIIDDNYAWRRSNLKPWQIMAEEWSLSGRDSGFLLTGPAFNAARKEARSRTLSPVETDYLAASERPEADRRRRRRSTILLIALLIVALLGAGSQWHRADVEAGRANSSGAAAQAIALIPDDPLKAIETAERALTVAYTTEAEDALRQAISQNVPTAVLAHVDNVTSVAFSPDGSRLVTTSWDATARVWDGRTGALLHVLRYDSRVMGAWFGPDGRSLFALTRVGALTVAQVDEAGTPAPIAEDVTAPVAFSKDGSRLAAIDSADDTVRIIDVASRKAVLAPLAGNTGAINATAFSGDGKLVASAGQDGTVRVWDAATGAAGPVLTGPEGGAFSVAFRGDKDATAIAAGDGTGSVRIWPLRGPQAGASTPSVKAQEHGPALVVFNRLGQLLAYGDKSPRLHDGTTGTTVDVLEGHRSWTNTAQFTPDGSRLVTSSVDGTARIWDTRSGQEVAVLGGHEGSVFQAVVAPAGDVVATAAGRFVRLFRLPKQQLLTTDSHDWMQDAAFLPGGKAVAGGMQDGRVVVWDSATGAVIAERQDHGSVQRIDVDRSGTYIASANSDGTVRIWDWRANTVVKEAKNVLASPADVEFDPTGETVVVTGVGSADTMKVWPWRSGAPRDLVASSIRGFPIFPAAFSPDGQYIAGATAWSVKLWRVSGAGPVWTGTGHTSDVNDLAFSADGSQLVSASLDGTARVWRTSDGEQLYALPGHHGAVLSARFDVTGDRVVTGAIDGSVSVWDSATQHLLATYPAHAQTVNHVEFSADAPQRILSASDDSTVRTFECDACGPLDALRDRARQLTAADGRNTQ